MEKETVESVINFAMISGLLGIFGWVTKSLIDQNKSTASTFEQFKSLLDREKTVAIENERSKYQIELHKKDAELEILKLRYNSLEEDNKREIERLSRITSQGLIDHLTLTKNNLESALTEVRQELTKKGIEEDELKQKLAKLEQSIQTVSVLDVSKIKRYESRLENDLIAADWLNEQSQNLISRFSQSMHNYGDEIYKEFKKDIASIIDWLRRSLTDGDPQSDEVVVTATLPKADYDNVIEEIRQYGQQNLSEEPFNALDFYLKAIVLKIKGYRSQI
jgi:hypothetical protein